MVTYSYSITASGPSIQSAINNVVQELSTSPSIDRDIEIIIDKGTYAGFKIPDAALFPLFESSYRLVIKAKPATFPIIDFNFSNSDQVVGIDIGSGNPNVKIQGLRIQYFPVGIRAGLNSHYPIVANCIINNNRNVGIFFEQCKEAQAIQNIVINGDYGIVSRLTKSAAIVHNTIFMNGAISSTVGTSMSCIWAELANDYGGGESDTGLLHIVGNIGWNTTGRALTLFLPDVENDRVICDFNDWVKSTEELVALEDNAFYRGPNSQPRRVFSDIVSWKTMGLDLHSKSEDPKFISPVKIRKDRNGYAVDLNLLPVSPVLGHVPSFAFDSALVSTYLPVYFDTTYLLKDILNQNRNQSGTAIGANDKLSTSGFFGQDVFSNPLDLDITKNCGVDPFSNVLFKSLELWFPKFKSGYFYSNEREYYLYSKKLTKTLGELATTVFSLPAKLAPGKPIVVKVAGKVIDTTYYDVSGTNFILKHKDCPIFTGEEEVEIEGWISNWNSNSFVFNKVLYILKIHEGETYYYLPDNYVSKGPVVVTDDLTNFTDSDYTTNREYSVWFDQTKQENILEFANHTNTIINGQFDYRDTDDSPLYWISSGATLHYSSVDTPSVAGRNVCKLSDQGYIKRIVPVKEYSNLSFHTMSYGSGLLEWTVEFYDHNFEPVGYIVTGEIEASSEWRRYNFFFNNSGINYDLLVPQVPYPCIPLNNIIPPEPSTSMLFKFKHIENPAFTGDLVLDAIQYEYTQVPTLYHRKHLFDELTVEFETSEEEYYIDKKLSMSPVTNLNSDGFIFIPEIPAEVYGGPKDPAITTLHEWRWPYGRKYILPWARTKGKDKLRKRPKDRFNFIPSDKTEIISVVNKVAQIKEIELIPTIPTTFVGDTDGVGFTVKITDTDQNPSCLTDVTVSLKDYNAKYPGLLSKKNLGLKEQLGPAIKTKTDSSGNISLLWIPPDKSAGVYKGSIPSPTLISTAGDQISVIKTEYPVSLESLGNVTIFDSVGNNIQTFSDTFIKNTYSPTYSAETSVIKLRYPIKPGSIKLKANGIRYKETQINILSSDEFFVDYENSIVTVKGRVTNIDVEYQPSYILVSEVDPYKIMIYHNQVFESVSGLITVGYDFTVKLTVSCLDPATRNTITNTFDLVAQNPTSTKFSTINTISLEF